MKKMGIVLTAVILLASCGFTSYNLEPSFLRYPFEKIFDYELQTAESGNDVLFVPESTLEEGALIYDYYDDGSDFVTTYGMSIWNGSETSSITASLGDMKPYVFPLSDTNTFVQITRGDTFTNKISVFQADSTSFTQDELVSYEVDFSTDFPGLSNLNIENPCFENGRLYFIAHNETSIVELSYQVSSSVVSDPQATWLTFIEMDALYEQFFKDVQEGDTFWQAADVSIEGYRHYPGIGTGVTALVASMNIEFENSSDIRFIITYNGTVFSGLQISADVYNVVFLSGGYVVTEELDPDLSSDIVRLYDLNGTDPVEVDSLKFQQNELSIIGEAVYNDETVILWTPVFDDINNRTKAALYALPLSYLLEDAE